MIHISRYDKIGHAITGLTCNNKRYIYDSNMKKPILCDWLEENATDKIRNIYTKINLEYKIDYVKKIIQQNKFEILSIFNNIIDNNKYNLDKKQPKLTKLIKDDFNLQSLSLREANTVDIYTKMCIYTYLHIFKNIEYNNIETHSDNDPDIFYNKYLADEHVLNNKNNDDIETNFIIICKEIIFPRKHIIREVSVPFMVTQCVNV